MKINLLVHSQLTFLKLFLKHVVKKIKNIPLYFVSLPGNTLDAGLKYRKIASETVQDLDIFFVFENGIPCGVPGSMGKSYVIS